MTSQTAQNATAAALVDEMIVRAEAETKLVNSMLLDALLELERRNGQAKMDLINGLNISDTGIIASAAKVERMVERRTREYLELNALKFTRKAC